MRFFGFNKINKHKRFDYVPRYYDPEKEELEARVQATKSRLKTEEESINPAHYASRITQSFRRERQKPSLLDMGLLPSLVRVFIAVVLAGAFWVYMHYGDKLGKTDTSQIITILLATGACLVGLILLLRKR